MKGSHAAGLSIRREVKCAFVHVVEVGGSVKPGVEGVFDL